MLQRSSFVRSFVAAVQSRALAACQRARQQRRSAGRKHTPVDLSALATLQVLEDRLVCDVAATVIIHGFQFPGLAIPSFAQDQNHWIAQIAQEDANAARRDGFGSPNPNFQPVAVTQLDDVHDEQLLSKWQGSRDYLVANWSDRSYQGALAVNFDVAAHRDAVVDAATGTRRMLEAFVRNVTATQPGETIDLHFVAHCFGTVVVREIIDQLVVSPQASQLDFIKATMLDPVAMKPVANPAVSGPENAARDKFYWYHPELQGVDAVANFYQDIGVIPVGIHQGDLVSGKPIDDHDGGGSMAVYSGTARIWNAATGAEEVVLQRHLDQVQQAVYSNDGKFIATASQDSTAKLWDAVTGQEIRSITGHGDNVSRVAFSPDSSLLVTGSRDNKVRVFRVSDGSRIRVLDESTNPVKALSFSPDGSLLAVGTGNNVRLYRMADWNLHKLLTGPTNEVSSVSFSPDGKTVAVSTGRTVRLWDSVTGNELAQLTGPTGHNAFGVAGLNCHRPIVPSVAHGLPVTFPAAMTRSHSARNCSATRSIEYFADIRREVSPIARNCCG